MPQSKWRKLLIGELSWKRLGRSLVFIYTFFMVYVFFVADRMIFLPQPASYQDTENILKLPVSDSEKISATYLPNPEADYTLLYIHGNAEDLGDIQPMLIRLQSWGFGVFAYDYRGYGTSDGKPSERNAYEEAETAYQYLTQQLGVSPDKVILYGRSVGGGSAVELATRHSVAGLILESTFTSAFRVVVPIPILPFDKFPSVQRIAQVDCPVLVMHGEADADIPVEHGQRLYDAALEPKLSLWIEGAGHNDFTWVAEEQHQAALVEFQRLIEQSTSLSRP
ncbi:alpha/beta hydrolase [Leptolyngbya sp. FACHB-541]|uniref:alpha/beta hydrolase n=1 Tax=Leptolyngbya sp. FACHB-541 TaxID=2692810 RepID=UPI001682E6B7|nr:alpha/beta hydrolase [Leptolyngbya sp. FACHB-541]MBD1995651.1 alpha/beta hydrolase [Leptolyngbya sp. FACHB-541]